MLLAGISLFLASGFRGELKDAAIAFAIGVCGGFAIDCVGVGKLHLWHYPRQPFLGMRYFFLVVPAWGVFVTTINLFWNWIGDPWWVAVTGLVLGQFGAYEFINFVTRSWKYQAPMWLVLIGWFPLVLSFRGFFLIFSEL